MLIWNPRILKNISIGCLILFSVLAAAKDYRGAEYRTIETYRYGRFETRMKAAPHSGIISSLCTFHEYGDAGVANWNEIDIEFLGRYTDRVQYNAITSGISGHEHSNPLNYDPAEAFHIYAFEWTPDYVAWFVDGLETHRQTGSHIDDLHRYQKLMMNIWPSTSVSWAGAFNEADLPSYAFYDYVTYYYYMPGTGNTGTDNNFIQYWQDDFESWDTNRWQKAAHTWDTNNCDFIPDNAVVTDGYLVLCLTTPGNTGYHGPALSTEDDHGAIPTGFYLSPAYPNPFNGEVRLALETPDTANLTMSIYDATGGLKYHVALPDDGREHHFMHWDGRDQSGELLASGAYIVQVSSPNRQTSQKVVLLK